jgi:hypothetical protein
MLRVMMMVFVSTLKATCLSEATSGLEVDLTHSLIVSTVIVRVRGVRTCVVSITRRFFLNGKDDVGIHSTLEYDLVAVLLKQIHFTDQRGRHAMVSVPSVHVWNI